MVDQNKLSKSLVVFLDNEKGVALIFSLLTLVILSFMGLSGIFTASDELSLAGNFRGEREAFFAAEGGIQYVHEDINYFNRTKYSGSGSSYVGGFPRTGVSLCDNGTDAIGSMTFMSSGPPPVGSGTSIKTHQADYYTITSTGRGYVENGACVTLDGSQGTQVQVMAKILPK